MILTSEREAYENIATAIVLQAVKDFVIAKKQNDVSSMHSITRFFRSQYFYLLSDLDPEIIISRLSSVNAPPRVDIEDLWLKKG